VSDTRAAPQIVRYSERLWVPWWWWPPALALAALIALEVNQGVRTLPDWVPFAVLLPVAGAVLVWFSKTEVRVVGGGAGDPAAETELWVGAAHLPVSVISRSAEVPRSAKSAALGRQLDPAAFVVHRAWVGPMVCQRFAVDVTPRSRCRSSRRSSRSPACFGDAPGSSSSM